MKTKNISLTRQQLNAAHNAILLERAEYSCRLAESKAKQLQRPDLLTEADIMVISQYPKLIKKSDALLKKIPFMTVEKWNKCVE